MANALLLGQASRLGDAQGVGVLADARAQGQNMMAQRQQMGQQNALFQQQQEDRQRQMQEAEQEKQMAPLREDYARFMTLPDDNARTQAWQGGLAQHYGQDPNSDWRPAIMQVTQRPGFLPPALVSKVMENLLAPKQPDFAQQETARHNRATEAAANERNQNMRHRLDNPPMPKPPAGFNYNADRSALERTPGGPADQKFRADKAEDEAALDSGLSSINATIANVDALIGADMDDPKTPRDETKEHPGLKAITGSMDARTPTFFQTSKDAEVLAEVLRSQASIQGLGNVRASAGSIGSMTQAEWPRLESLIAALQQSQGTPQFKQNLKMYRNELGIVRSRLQKKFKETYDGGGKVPEIPQQPAYGGGSVFEEADAILDRP